MSDRTVAATKARQLSLLLVQAQGRLSDPVSRYLRRHGYRVRLATDGATALDLLCRERINIVLLELRLPRLDGFAVLRQLHKRRQESFPYVIAVSDSASDLERQKVRDLGANEYLAKPLQLTRLLERIQSVEKFLC